MVDYSTVNDDRVILLLDMDCFEVQVHEKPWMIGQPRVVANSKDKIVAVSYEAKRDFGINRESTPYVNDALARCPDDLIIIRTPTQSNGRPYTLVAKEATEVIKEAIRGGLCKQGMTEGKDFVFQFSSDDEFYIDLTPYLNFGQGWKRLEGNFLTHASDNLFDMGPLIFLYSNGTQGEPHIGDMRQKLWELAMMEECGSIWNHAGRVQERRLIFGAYIAAYVVQYLFTQTQFKSSVGVGSNKLMAKIAGGQHKPGSITIASPLGFKNFAHQVDMGDVPGLGAALGNVIKNNLDVYKMGHFHRVEHEELASCIQAGMANCSWKMAVEEAGEVLRKGNGLCNDPVDPVDFYGTLSSEFKFHGWDRNFTHEELRTYLENDVFNEFADKLQFEARWHNRMGTRIKLTVSIENGLAMTAILLGGGFGSDVTGQDLCNKLKFKFPLTWQYPHLSVTTIKIIASKWGPAYNYVY